MEDIMTHKRNGFLNFCFSCWPGAGQMYQGFLKRGVSIMLIFFGIITLAAWSGVDEILFCLPIIWFYGFFDAINTNSLSDEEFIQVKDEYLFVRSGIDKMDLKKFRIPVAVFLVLLGIYSLMKEFLGNLVSFGLLSWETVYVIEDMVPRTVFSLAVIAMGVYLIYGKKTELQEEEVFLEEGNGQPEKEEGDGE